LTLWGLLVVGTIDNLLRPILVGNRLKLPTVLAFISVLGGLLQFGAAGLILGPAILAVTTVLLEIWSGRALEETSSHPRLCPALDDHGAPAEGAATAAPLPCAQAAAALAVAPNGPADLASKKARGSGA
jgi:hypothetical protein